MSDEAAAQVRFHLTQLARLRAEFADLAAQSLTRQPSMVERAALATMLHSFYGGVEGVFDSIADLIDQEVPKGADSHSALLEQMMGARLSRPAVIDATLAHALREYLRFRHFFRHAYSCELK